MTEPLSGTPLTDAQKLTLMSLNRKLLMKQNTIFQLQKELASLGQQQENTLREIFTANGIDLAKFALDEDLNAVPIPTPKI